MLGLVIGTDFVIAYPMSNSSQIPSVFKQACWDDIAHFDMA